MFAGGSRLFIASLAVQVVTGFSMTHSILVLGAIAVVYTLFGGIKAVIWTDVVQAVILVGGALLSIALLLHDIPMDLGEVSRFLAERDKFRLFEAGGTGAHPLFSNAYHFVPAILGGLFLTMASHGTDQSMIQRLLTCKDSFRGKLSLVLSGFLGIGVTLLFLAVGMLLFVYAATRPEGDGMLTLANELRASGKPDQYYLHYILHGLPPGVSGMLIAALVAAAMSSIDSELNSMSATFVNDFYGPYLAPAGGEQAMLKVAKLATIVCGVLLMGVAVLIADFYEKNPQTDLLSIALGVMTLFYGALLGIFLLGLLTRTRGNSSTNIAGMCLATLLILFIRYKSQLLPALGWVDAAAPGDGFWGCFYQGTLAWPWFIIVGTTVTVVVAVLGRTAAHLVERYRDYHASLF